MCRLRWHRFAGVCTAKLIPQNYALNRTQLEKRSLMHSPTRLNNFVFIREGTAIHSEN